MRVVFMGTPDIAVTVLNAIIEDGHTVPLVVTQPDRQKGRGKVVQFTPVKEVAVAHDIPVIQPERLSEDGVFEELQAAQPDVIVVIAYGQILKENVLNLPKYGCINVHASLLPKYRGAAPIQWAVIDGEKESGVTTMYMEKGLDTGDMIDKAVVPLAEDETGGSLHDKLAVAGAQLILQTLRKVEALKQANEQNSGQMRFRVDATAQNDADSSYAKMLDKALGNIDWNVSAVSIEQLIRGLNPWPSAYTFVNGKMLKLWVAKVLSEQELPSGADCDQSVGSVVYVDKKHIIVKCGADYLRIDELQLEGKKRMETDAFLRGYRMQVGTEFTNER